MRGFKIQVRVTVDGRKAWRLIDGLLPMNIWCEVIDTMARDIWGDSGPVGQMVASDGNTYRWCPKS